MQTSVWALQLRNDGSTACRTGGWLRFLSVRDPRGRRMHAKFSYDFAAYGHSTRPFLLLPGGRAFAQMAQPILNGPRGGCAAHAELAFEAPHEGGRLSVAMPERHAVCPHVWIAVSPIRSSKAFYAAMEQLSQSGGMHLPYSRSARALWVPRATPASCVPTAQKRCQLDVLRPDGIGSLRFGASPRQARRVIDALLHQGGGPTQRSGSCAVRRQITWQDQWTANAQPGLTLYFGRSGLIGYQVGAPQEPRRPRGGWMLATARGLHVGDSLKTGRDLYGSSIALSANQGGVWVIRSAGGTLDGYAWGETNGHSDVSWSSLVASINAGNVGCPSASP